MNRLLLIYTVWLFLAPFCRVAGDEPARDWRREYAAFRRLPEPKRQRLRQLDQALHAEDVETRERLVHVMQRYSDWLSRLSAADREKVEEATSIQEKVQRIRQIREQQWVDTLPRTDRERVAQAKSADERQAVVGQIRRREAEQELHWQLAQARTEDREEITAWMNKEMKKWVEEKLKPRLSVAERRRLQKVPPRRPAYFGLLVQLARKYGEPIPPPLQKLAPISKRPLDRR